MTMTTTNKKTETNIWAYLESAGVLDGTDAEIKAAKRVYMRNYFKKYRRTQRQERPEFTISFSRKSGDYGKIALGAKKHHMPITAFVRVAALSYLDRSFIVPNANQIARLEQLLMSCLNEVQKITRTKERYQWERERKYDAIAEQINALETEIRNVLRFPKEVTTA
jgi:hypothetical protein